MALQRMPISLELVVSRDGPDGPWQASVSVEARGAAVPGDNVERATGPTYDTRDEAVEAALVELARRLANG